MKNQETELDEKALKEIMADMVTEMDKCNQFMTEQKRAIEQKDRIIAEKQTENARLIANFEQKYKTIQVVAPKPDNSEMFITVANGLMEIRKMINEQLNQHFAKNKVLVLPEDKGKLYFKIKAKQIGILAILVTAICFISWFGFHYLYLNSKNSNFRKVWYWNYIHRDSLGKKKMDDQLSGFLVSDTDKLRTDSIDMFLKRQENKENIKTLEKQIDSLKASNPYAK